MKGDRELLSDLWHVRGWGWYRVRRSAKNGNKSGYKVMTDKGIKFVKVSELPEFVKANLVKGG